MLKADKTKFYSWLEEQENHTQTMVLKHILRLGPSVSDVSHPVHYLFPAETYVLSSCGRVAIDEVMILSNERHATEAPNGPTEILKEFLCTRMFDASDKELQCHLSLSANFNLRRGDVTLKSLLTKSLK